ncbi:hypothetical protein HDU93_006335, partial [Gonapodya sp. JEL0774]
MTAFTVDLTESTQEPPKTPSKIAKKWEQWAESRRWVYAELAPAGASRQAASGKTCTEEDPKFS